jgi:ubiquinone/menaquinone biosynthesis C-methylase UbiE
MWLTVVFSAGFITKPTKFSRNLFRMSISNNCNSDSCVKAISKRLLGHTNDLSGNALDVGCGDGEYAELLKSRFKFIAGVDIINFFNHSKICKGLGFVQADGFKLPFKDETFELAVSMDVLEHVGNDILFLEESKRVLKDNGVILVGTPNLERLSNKLKTALGKKIIFPCVMGKDEKGDCVHLREYTEESLKKILVNSGFRKITIEKIWFGIRHKFIGGVENPPLFFKIFGQYLLARAVK